MQDELLDRFGEIPKPCMNLLRIALLRAEAHHAYVTEADIRKGSWKLLFDASADIRVEEIPVLIREQQGRLRFVPGKQTIFFFRKNPQEKFGLFLKPFDGGERFGNPLERGFPGWHLARHTLC